MAGPSGDKSAGDKAAGDKAGQAEKDSSSKPIQKRRFPRYTIDLRMQVTMFQGGEFLSCWGRSTEMGEDGIGATLTGDLESGEIVSLEIPLPLSPYPLKVRAIVRFRQGLHYGFEFLALTGSQRDTLQRVCQMLATKE